MTQFAPPPGIDSTSLRLAIVLPSAARGTYWIGLLREFTSKTSRTVVFTADPGPLAPGTDTTAGLDIRVLGLSKWVGRSGEDDYHTGMRFLSPHLALQLWKMKPDVVVTMAFSMWSLLIAAGRRLGLWRMVILYDGSSPAVDHVDSRIRTRLRRWMVNTADASISNSVAGRDYLVNHLGAGATAKAMPFMVCDPKALGEEVDTPRDEDTRVLLAVGGLQRRKGIHLLLNALASPDAANLPDWRLVLAGDGPERDRLEAQALELGIADRVSFEGWVNYDQLGKFFRQADVFVFPTLADTWGVVLLEAMTFGKAIVASSLAGSSELVEEGVTGHVIDPYDDAALAKAIEAVITDPALARRMGETSRRHIAAHTPAAAAARLLSLFNSITAES